MRLAAISDVHGNLAALNAVLDDIAGQRVDAVLNLGDILSGPLWVAETADRLMPLDLPTIAGNHERQVLTQVAEAMGASDRHAAERLSDRHRDWLAGLPATLHFSAEVFCCHGTPGSDFAYFLETVMPDFAPSAGPGIRRATLAEATQRAGDAMRGVPHALILCGHTHLPRRMQLADGRLVVNPGSVGLPGYDDAHPHFHLVGNGSPHARYAVLSRQRAGWQVDFRAVAYDDEAAAGLAEQHGRGDWADALRTGRVGRCGG